MADEANSETVTGGDEPSKDCCSALEDLIDAIGRVAVVAETARGPR
jgi:hypothetical protein